MDDRLHNLAFQLERLERRLASLERSHSDLFSAYIKHVKRTHAGWTLSDRLQDVASLAVDRRDQAAAGKTSRRAVAVANRTHKANEQRTKRKLGTAEQQTKRAARQLELNEGSKR